MFRRRINGYLILLLILFTIQVNQLYSQQNRICYQCKKSIIGRFIEADGKIFHPEHFLCAKCNKQINGAFQSKDGKYFHPDCYLLNEGMICDYCHKILDREYTTSNGKKYHTDCYEKFILPKCSICGLPLTNIFRVDIYENKYHTYHDGELKRCDCCGRLICNSLTRGGSDYSDGRHICNLCYETAIREGQKYNELLISVMSKLNSFGISLSEKTISINAVDRTSLKMKSRNYSDNTYGFCDSRTESESINKKLVKQITIHVIYVLSGMPLLLTESTIAHELMHAWLNENTKDNHPDWLREGSCNYISYLYLKAQSNNGKSDFITMLEKDSSPIYGKGFITVRSRFEGKQMKELLKYLKE